MTTTIAPKTAATIETERAFNYVRTNFRSPKPRVPRPRLRYHRDLERLHHPAGRRLAATGGAGPAGGAQGQARGRYPVRCRRRDTYKG